LPEALPGIACAIDIINIILSHLLMLEAYPRFTNLQCGSQGEFLLGSKTASQEMSAVEKAVGIPGIFSVISTLALEIGSGGQVTPTGQQRRQHDGRHRSTTLSWQGGRLL
jgi:hypothetical protein